MMDKYVFGVLRCEDNNKINKKCRAKSKSRIISRKMKEDKIR